MFWKQTASSSGEQGSSLLPNFGSMLSIFMTMENVLVKCCWYYSRLIFHDEINMQYNEKLIHHEKLNLRVFRFTWW